MVQFSAGSGALLRSMPPLGKKPVIVRMGSDPEPDDFVPFENPDRSIARADPNGVDWACRMHRLETKTGMIGVLSEEAVGLTSSMLNFRQ